MDYLENNKNINIYDSLKKLNRKNTVFFTWLCAVRALPFLGTKALFNTIDSENKKINIYQILKNIDKAGEYIINPKKSHTVSSIATFNAFSAVKYSCSDNNTEIKYNDNYPIHSYATDAVYIIIKTAEINNINLINILFNDIKCIESNEYSKFDNNIDVYNNIWERFQNIFKNIGCIYWGNLYMMKTY